MTKGYETICKLMSEGWSISHTATYNGYRSAGVISSMKSHDGYEYCRVHEGKSVGKAKYQLTTVMKRRES